MMRFKYGEILYRCRTEAGLRQIDIAATAGSKCDQVSMYENERTVPLLTTYAKLIDACGYELAVRKKGR